MRSVRYLFFLICFMVVPSTLSAQDFYAKIPYYNMINYDENDLKVPGEDTTLLNDFFRRWGKLWALGTEQINILHIGGSHVQADVFSNRIRLNLGMINNMFRPSRGFIFPFSTAKTNNPTNYTVRSEGLWSAARNVQRNREIPLGVGGIAVYTEDSEASITVSLNTGESMRRWDFDELLVLGGNLDYSDQFEPYIVIGDTLELTGEHYPYDRYYRFRLPFPAESFTLRFKQKDSRPHTFILDGFLPLKDEPGIVYHSIGVNGAAVPSYLGCEYFDDELRLINPDLVIFGIGINDATSNNFTKESFISDYNMLLNKIRRVNPQCAFLFITNNDSFTRVSRNNYQVNRNGLIAREAFFEIAEQNNGAVWDLFELMGGLRSMEKWQQVRLAQRDKIHFTNEGYLLLGDLLYNAMMHYYIENDLN